MRVCGCTGAIYIQCGGSPRVLGERGLCKPTPLMGLGLRLAPGLLHLGAGTPCGGEECPSDLLGVPAPSSPITAELV